MRALAHASRAAAALALTALTALLAACGEQRREPAPPPVATILQDDAELLHRPPAQIAATLDDIRDLGVDWVRVTAGWSVIAPAPRSQRRPRFDARDPAAYPRDAWRALDRVDRMAGARGLRTAIDIAFWAPRWAVAARARRGDRERDAIDVEAYADFAEAVARRYSGAVAFTVWNEPNHNAFLLPQWERAAGGWRPAAPHLYRAMVHAAVPRIRAAAPGAIVLIGATSSVGSARGGDPDARMAPLTFAREMACVDETLAPLERPECASFRPLPGDGWSHHPYSLELAPWQPDPQDDAVRMADLGRLTSLLARLHERGRTATHLPLYLTESGYQTNPPDLTRAVALDEHARWLPEAERIARAEPSVRAVAQFLMRDLPERPGGSLRARWGDYQSGLRFADGRPKPAHAAFALPLVARRARSSRVAFWGLVRPGSGRRDARIEVRDAGGGWRTIARLRTRADGSFDTTVAIGAGGTFRLRSGSLVGAAVQGARQPAAG
ncbi:MAG: cellulase family glycosylhydrolase [Thermoleophilia bacterium]